jgi:hypothetical protein
MRKISGISVNKPGNREKKNRKSSKIKNGHEKSKNVFNMQPLKPKGNPLYPYP